MPLYEHVMIARQDLSNTQAEVLIEHFGTVLSDNGGSLVEHDYWGVKTMAYKICLLYTSPSPRDRQKSRMPSSA